MKVDKRSIESVIRAGNVQGLTDKRIAAQLDLGLTTISHWRNKFGIKPADKFYRKFSEKYANAGGLEHFRFMVEEKKTLQAIADHFGFSREYARQVYNKLYGKPRPVSDKREAQKRAWRISHQLTL